MNDAELLNLEKLVIALLEQKNKKFLNLVKAEIEKVGFTELQGDKKKLAQLRMGMLSFIEKAGFDDVASDLASKFQDVESLATVQLAQDLKLSKDLLSLGDIPTIRKDILVNVVKTTDTILKDEARQLRRLFSLNAIGQVKDTKQLFTLLAQSTKLSQAHLKTLTATTFAIYDRSVMTEKANAIGERSWIYAGQKDKLNRPLCAKRVRKTYTDSEAKEWNNGFSEYGFMGEADVALGGANCRHRKRYVRKQSVKEIEQKVKKQETPKLKEQKPQSLKDRYAYLGNSVKEIQETLKAKGLDPNGFEGLMHRGRRRFAMKPYKFKDLDTMRNQAGQTLELLEEYNSELTTIGVYDTTSTLGHVIATKTKGVHLGFASGNSLKNYIPIMVKQAKMFNESITIAKNFGVRMQNIENYNIKTATHEFFHGMWQKRVATPSIITQQQSIKFGETLAEIQRKYQKTRNALADKYREKVKLNDLEGAKSTLNEYKEIYISDYALTNLDEFGAEAFTDYKLNANPSPFSVEVGELVDKYFKKGN